MAKPLLDFLKKELSFEWKEEQQKAFEDLKEKLWPAPMLKFPYFTKSFEVHINANDFVINGVLMKKGHPIAFESKKLYGTQLWWPTHKGELYTIICCPIMWQHYLGTQKIKVFTNNVVLNFFEIQPRASTK